MGTDNFEFYRGRAIPGKWHMQVLSTSTSTSTSTSVSVQDSCVRISGLAIIEDEQVVGGQLLWTH